MSSTPYKTLTFEPGKIPKALLRSHSLKEQVRGRLHVTQGSLVFVDEKGARHSMGQGESMEVEPQAQHHLEEADDAAITIEFFRE